MIADFSGSYAAADVSFLLKPLTMSPITDLAEKERLIQSGRCHYSEIIGVERLPDENYMRLFEEAVEANLSRMARDLWALARQILDARHGRPTLVSLARAGTPVGVGLRRLLRDGFGIDAPHYSISIIRDRGIDRRAVAHVCRRHAPESIAFVDGWTGKGVIAAELHRALESLGTDRPPGLAADLFVLSDLAGVAAASGSTDDYLIPSSILNATVSGLVSRTILNGLVGPEDFHGCLFYGHLHREDRSRWFVDSLHSRAMALLPALEAGPVPTIDVAAARQRTATLVATLVDRHGVTDRNHVKPGIGETTRALLRRVPRLVVLRDPAADSVRHLRWLAEDRGVPVSVDRHLSLAAAAIIGGLSDG